MRDAAIAKRGQDLLTDRAGSQNQGGTLRQFAKNALGEFDTRGRDGHGAGAQFCLRAHAFSDLQGALEKAIEDWAGGALFVSEAVGLADLAEYFGFAKQHGIESGGDTEEVTHGFAVVMVVERAAEDVRAHGVKLAEKGGEVWRGFMSGFGRNAVDLAAVARR